ncbi:MAG: PepSY domain-containing protein, partial [Pseudomonadota bacterium]
GQHSSVIAEHPDRLIFGEYYNFTDAGAYEGNVGISDGTVGQQITGAVYNVHFGNWGGLPVKLAYLIFGIALCVIIASGLSIYFAKREAKGRPAPRLAATWSGLVWGTPTMLAVTLLVALFGGSSELLVGLFWVGLAITLGASSFYSSEAVSRYGRLAMAVVLAIVLATYFASFGLYAISNAGLGVSAALSALTVCMAYAYYRGSSHDLMNDAPTASTELGLEE